MGSLVPTLVAGDRPRAMAWRAHCTQAGHPACAGGPATASCQQAAAGYIQNLFTKASNPRDFSQDSMMYSLFCRAPGSSPTSGAPRSAPASNHEKKDGAATPGSPVPSGAPIPGYRTGQSQLHIPAERAVQFRAGHHPARHQRVAQRDQRFTAAEPAVPPLRRGPWPTCRYPAATSPAASTRAQQTHGCRRGDRRSGHVRIQGRAGDRL